MCPLVADACSKEGLGWATLHAKKVCLLNILFTVQGILGEGNICHWIAAIVLTVDYQIRKHVRNSHTQINDMVSSVLFYIAPNDSAKQKESCNSTYPHFT